MLSHKDPEVQIMLQLLEGQRDYAMGVAAAQTKKISELEARLADLTKQESDHDADRC